MIRPAQKMGVSGDSLHLAGTRDPLAFEVPVLNRAKLIEEALASRKELAAAGHQYKYAELNLTSLRRERYPWFSYEVDEVLARLEAVTKELTGYRRAILSLAASQMEVAKTELAAGQADRVEPLLAGIRPFERQSSVSD